MHDMGPRALPRRHVMTRPPSDNPEVEYGLSPRDTKNGGDPRMQRPLAAGVLQLTEEGSGTSSQEVPDPRKRPRVAPCNSVGEYLNEAANA